VCAHQPPLISSEGPPASAAQGWGADLWLPSKHRRAPRQSSPKAAHHE
jgi:hypothetical protein